jgi:hypothetical protein
MAPLYLTDFKFFIIISNSHFSVSSMINLNLSLYQKNRSLACSLFRFCSSGFLGKLFINFGKAHVLICPLPWHIHNTLVSDANRSGLSDQGKKVSDSHPCRKSFVSDFPAVYSVDG